MEAGTRFQQSIHDPQLGNRGPCMALIGQLASHP